MQSRRCETVCAYILIGATGLILGAALTRWTAENLFQYATLFYRRLPVALVAVLVAAVLVVVSMQFLRRSRARMTPLCAALCFLPLTLPALYLVQRRVATVQGSVLLVGSIALAAALSAVKLGRGDWLDRATLIAMFALPLALYVGTLAPTVGEHDTFEFQVLSYELGIAHPTGYPLYILLGKLFTLIPVGSVAYRVNLSSAVFAAATVAILYATIKELTEDRSASALAALCFAFSLSFWSQAVEAEVYALNALFVCATCYLLLLALNRPHESAEDSRNNSRERGILRRWDELPRDDQTRVLIIATTFLYGLSLTHHRTMLLLVPAFIAYLILKQAWRLFTCKHLVALVFAVLAPLIGLYLYIPLRWWQIHGMTMSWQQFTTLVLGTQFAAALRWDAVLHDPNRLLIYMRTLLEQYPIPVLILAAAGLVYLFRSPKLRHDFPSWREGLFLLLAFLGYVVFALSYYVPDVSLFLIPSHLVIAIALGIGLSALRRGFETLLGYSGPTLQSLRGPLTSAAMLTLVGLLPLFLIWTNLPRVDRSEAYASYGWGTYVLQQDLPADSVILADSEKVGPLHYLQRVEHVRPDTETGVFPDEDSNRAEMEKRLREGRPVFLARFLPGLESTYHLRSLGPLVKVSTDALMRLPVDVEPLSVSFADTMGLLGYRLDAHELDRSDPIRVTLYWQAQQRVARNFDVRLRLVGSTGHVWIQTNGRPPVNGLYPTGAWRPAEIVPDFHEIDLAGRIPPGSYSLQVGLFEPFTEEGLPPSDTEGDYFPLGEIVVSSAPKWRPVIDRPLRADFADRLMLLGFEVPSKVAPGSDVPLTLHWQARDWVTADYSAVLRLTTPDGVVVWQTVDQPFHGEHQTSDWRPGESLPDSYMIAVPDSVTGPLQLWVRLEDPASGASVPVFDGWLSDRRDELLLGTLRVLEPPTVSVDVEQLPANFDNKILLLDYEFHNVQVRKGGSLQLTLTWQALTTMDEDYTIFVHIIDDNDRIWGQEDIQPVLGTNPTSRWREGDIVVDPHTVWTDGQAPLGYYRVEVGLYLLRTMERLQLLDASGSAVDNRIILGLMEIVP